MSAFTEVGLAVFITVAVLLVAVIITAVFWDEYQDYRRDQRGKVEGGEDDG